MRYLLVIFLSLFSSTVLFPQDNLPVDIVKEGNYTITGSETLTAARSITLKPNTLIKAGSDFTASIVEDAYYAITLSEDQNYVFTRTYQRGMTSSSGISKNSDVIEGVTYYDGLGRPMQQVAIKASPDLNDLVTHMGYDALGRMDKEWLPMRHTGTNGSFRTSDMQTATRNYYKSTYPDDFTGVSTNQVNPFSQKQFEASPLNRIRKQAAPGKAWALGSGHEIDFDYQTNATNEVHLYQVSFAGGNTSLPSLSENGYYQAEQLYKMVTKDENHDGSSSKLHTTEEFTDKLGRVVLKRTYALVGSNETTHDTYYVYDDFDNLTYVLPPKVNTDDGISEDELDKLCYQYRYDHRNRLIEKKLPGKGNASTWEEIVYNKFNLPIMTRDPNLRAQGKWLFTKYDVFGRVVCTGILNSGSNRVTHQTNTDATTKHYETRQTSSSVVYDTSIKYSNDAYPRSGTGTLHTVNYYDVYTDAGGLSVPASVYGEATSDDLQGLPTVAKVRTLGTDDWTITITGYDNKGRTIYLKSRNNYLGVTDVVENKLDFTGKSLEIKNTHTKDGNSAIVITDKFDYDHMARLTEQTQKIGTQATALIAAKTYDELGQLVSKKVGNTVASPLQTVNYAYNVRGWLRTINDVDALGSDLFAFKLNYDQQEGEIRYDNLYNGNISQTIWRTTSQDSDKRGYSYQYDALDRITKGIMRKGDGLNVYTRHHLRSVAYDKNGNITALVRDNAAAIMDDLSYTYAGNQLTSVVDAITAHASQGLVDGNTSGSDYAYDPNGNMTADANKGITAIAYNHLNMPTSVTVASGQHNGSIAYTYDAAGMKLRKLATDTNTSTTDYAGSFIYKDGNLQFIHTAEGYAEPNNNGSFDHVFQYKDHLGNIRLSYSDTDGNSTITTVEIREENNYYPFGLKHKGYNNVVNGREHKYKFGGKELNDELGLNWYDITARNYDPAIGRWFVVDALAEAPEQISLSPYQYAWNNPIYYNDPDGNCPDCPWYLNDTPSGKGRVLTLGLHNIVLPTAERAEGGGAGAFIGNVAKSIWNGVASTWNAGMEGANMGDITSEGLSQTGDMARRIENGEGTIEDAENIVAAGAMMVVRGKVNGNSKSSTKAQHGYEITNETKGTRHKVGVSGGKLNKDGSSRRANSQVNKLNKQGGDTYSATVKTKVPEGEGARGTILDWEKNQVNQHYKETGTTAPGQKRPKPDDY